MDPKRREAIRALLKRRTEELLAQGPEAIRAYYDKLFEGFPPEAFGPAPTETEVTKEESDEALLAPINRDHKTAQDLTEKAAALELGRIAMGIAFNGRYPRQAQLLDEMAEVLYKAAGRIRSKWDFLDRSEFTTEK